MKISILTATYNRGEYLKRLYKSIVNNIGQDYEIEWLIMDDGSTDSTENVCNLFQNERGLKILYFKQENQGKMNAINNLSKYVDGDLWIECDSDDYFIEGSLKKIVTTYNNYDKKSEIYALAFLKYDQNGNNMGNNFKSNENTMFNLYFKDGEDGEKALVFITDVRKKYRYELEKNEKFVTEARLYHKMDKQYYILCINEPIMVCEYQNNGYTKNINKQFLSNPFGYYSYFYEILKDMDTSHILFSKRLYVVKHYILFTYLTKNKLNMNVKGLKNKLLILILYIPGIIKSRKFKKSSK